MRRSLDVVRALVVMMGLVLSACAKDDSGRSDEAPARAAPPDSAAAVRAALDTLTRTGAKDWTADSVVRHGDTITVWTGPRVWMATDRPMSAVSIIAPARVIAIRHIFGG